MMTITHHLVLKFRKLCYPSLIDSHFVILIKALMLPDTEGVDVSRRKAAVPYYDE